MESESANRYWKNPPQPHSYQAFGLTIESSVACPELLPQDGGAPEVSILYGTVPDALESVEKQESRYELNAEEFLLKIPGVAKYLVIDGREVIVEPSPGVPEEDVRLFLLGSVFGALLHQRGLLPLHGCALEINGSAVIFVGPSGIGKSSLAGALHQRGHRLITDDVSVLSFLPEGQLVVQPSCRHLKLCPDALWKMGKNPAAYPLVLSDLEKHHLPLSEGFSDHALPVRWIYELAAHDSQSFQITSFQDNEKLNVLITHTYRLEFLEGTSSKLRYLQQCGRVSRQVSISRILRPRWPFLLDELVDLLEGECLR